MKLTEHFTLKQFLVSKDHPKLIANHLATKEQINRLYLLCVFGLEKLHNRFGGIVITSGLRSVELNRALGGVIDSQHLAGEAVDFVCSKNYDMKVVYGYILNMMRWPGEVLYHESTGHIHLALPRFGLRADYMAILA